MGVHSEIKNAFKPLAEKYGLNIFAKNSYSLVFMENHYRRLDIDTYPSGYISMHFFGGQAGSFYMCDFCEGLGINDYLSYENHEEFELLLNKLIDIFDNRLMPYIEFITPLVVNLTYEMYKELSVNTVERAETFMKKHDLQPEHKLENYNFVEDYLTKLRGKNRSLQNIIFNEKFEQILGAAAYIGEIKRRRHSPAQWGWEESPRYIANDGITFINDYRYLIMKGDDMTIDPLENIVSLWNYYPELKRFSLKNYRNNDEGKRI